MIHENDFIYFYDNYLYILNSKSIHELLLYQYHDNKNHFNIEKIYQTLSRRYFWSNFNKDIRKYITSYSQYLHNKISNQIIIDLLYFLLIFHKW